MKILAQLNTCDEVILLLDNSSTISKNLINKLSLTLNSNPEKVILVNPFIEDEDGLLKGLTLDDPQNTEKFVLLKRVFQLSDLVELGRSKVKNVIDRVFKIGRAHV